MTTGHLQVTGLAGHATLTVLQHDNNGRASMVASCVLGHDYALDIARQLIEAVTPTILNTPDHPPRVVIRRRGNGVWVAVCPRHPQPVPLGGFHNQHTAIRASHNHLEHTHYA